ncbi:hypothetical protein SRABI123_01402 [Pseudomonas sp. Bi123]|nr:hypothetical protein SRABI123_01402 [Pseudomonas sp. Bi123]
MRCFICEQPATDVPETQGGRLVNCSDCGWYKISGTALHLMREHVRVFNVPRSREWLGLQRTNGITQPLIQGDTNLWD